MPQIDRRFLLNAFALSGAAALAPRALSPAAAEPSGAAGGRPPAPRFGFDDVVKRARDLAAAPYDAAMPKLPEALNRLDFDAYRDIRFKPEKSPITSGPYRLQLFHPGFIYKRPVVVNTIRDGIATPIPFSTSLFDYGRAKFEKNLPVNLGFAGFRLHYPLNSPHGQDELVSFLGATYFRFLGRGQSYGLSARGLAVNTGGDDEEFPYFREFWIETSAKQPEKATIFALLDSASVTGAYQFELTPGDESVMEVAATIFPRRDNVKFGLAPLTSMFFLGEDRNSGKPSDDWRPELHDSDGLLMHTATGEWIWRPLRAPRVMAMSTFPQDHIKGFGLVQRDRNFDHYQDLELLYEIRPTYFVEPHGDWGEGRIELLELATKDETADNIVAYWTPTTPPPSGKPFSYSYRIRALLEAADLSPAGRVVNTWKTWPKALGSNETVDVGSRRFIVDFAGGDLAFYAQDPSTVQINASASLGKVTRTILMPNPHIKGFRAFVDVQVEPGQSTNISAFLHAGPKKLTETWLEPWIAE
ncbi:glucan biosynthesis protein G [Rhodoblastus acidophilus]|uniref:Glucans biosynthesis protein G n=1 Tax=Candidatus Rhodoblastus alkanivorans TaxID=2954117 RepID=A0ABS9Z4H2_9HYPH|nr:glucan biosynthesis protein G [Candidatus Rhodoblastus alkanivorans]MCI4680668.1 glucan biosynthesis protein G [Candidatus Rhodoblastus alkanivorans]MCI4682534.1 glucan biosynthesis protein G [Candidatus Rhodoblastus alkanivorans]MDI4639840.1 glucan biosynthesis protein G [Rhodoblastus acidophilus]